MQSRKKGVERAEVAANEAAAEARSNPGHFFVLAAEGLLGGGSGETAVGDVDLGREGGVPGRIAPLEGICRGLPAPVADVASPLVLGDEPGELGAGGSSHLGQVGL